MAEQSLQHLLETTTGPSKSLDKAIARELDVPVRDYSSSVDACLDLIHVRLASVHWHVGRGADGVSMYATMNKGRRRLDATSVTVPLALLNVIAKFLKQG